MRLQIGLNVDETTDRTTKKHKSSKAKQRPKEPNILYTIT